MARYAHERARRFTSIGAIGDFNQVPANNGTTTGPGDEIAVPIDLISRLPFEYTWDVHISGGTLSAFVANLEGSPDGTNWYTVDTSGASGGISATTGNGMQHVANKVVRFLRINVTTFTSASGTPVANGGITM